MFIYKIQRKLIFIDIPVVATTKTSYLSWVCLIKRCQGSLIIWLENIYFKFKSTLLNQINKLYSFIVDTWV